jgi:hypothetical protein
MNALGIILLILLIIAAAIAAFILGVWVVVWNVNDIAAHGANFWNIFWILLVLTGLVGGTTKATK